MKAANRCLFLTLFFVLTGAAAFSPGERMYRIFTGKGRKASYKTLLKKAKKADVVFFGEEHGNPVCHWLELQLTKDLYQAKKDQFKLGMEMLEADDQPVVDEYINGTITSRYFERSVKQWDNFERDYKPVLSFCRNNGIPVTATNVPRRYANLVARKGKKALDSLSEKALDVIAPVPLEIDTSLRVYKRLQQMGAHGGHGSASNMVQAQALKDATMAHFILRNCREGDLFFHLNGSFHSDYGEGIVWYLKQAGDSLDVLTISTRSQKSTAALKEGNKNIADFVIVTPEDLPPHDRR